MNFLWKQYSKPPDRRFETSEEGPFVVEGFKARNPISSELFMVAATMGAEPYWD